MHIELYETFTLFAIKVWTNNFISVAVSWKVMKTDYFMQTDYGTEIDFRYHWTSQYKSLIYISFKSNIYLRISKQY